MVKKQIQILDLITDDIDDEFIITIYGKSLEEENVVLNVSGFKPFFYVRVPDNWDLHTLEQYIGKEKSISFPREAKKIIYGKKEGEYDIKIEFIRKNIIISIYMMKINIIF